MILAVLEESIIDFFFCYIIACPFQRIFVMCTKTFLVKTTKTLSIIPHEKSIDLFLCVYLKVTFSLIIKIYVYTSVGCGFACYELMLRECLLMYIVACMFLYYAQISSNIPRQMNLTDFLFYRSFFLFQML